MKLLAAGLPDIIDELGCFRCGKPTGDWSENGKRYVNCGPCREAIRSEALRKEIDRMDWPEIVGQLTTHLVTFSDSNMSRAAQLCVESSKAHGVNTHARFTPAHVSSWDKVKAHRDIFKQPDDVRRAWSWWAFKPLITDRELSWLPDDSILIYADAGIEFLDNVNHIIDRMDQDIFLFGNMWEHAHWCKQDIFNEVWQQASHQAGCFGKQVQASVIFFRVNDNTRAFVKEWLDWCLFEGGRLIDDSPSRAPNHSEFRENRHDQAILTTMAYRDGYKLHWWPSRYNMDQPGGGFIYPKDGYESDTYPPLFFHHRRRNSEWPSFTVKYDGITREELQVLEDHFNASRA